MRDSQMKLTKDFFKITNVLVVGEFLNFKVVHAQCSHQDFALGSPRAPSSEK